MIVDNIQQIQNLKNKSVFLYPIKKDDRLHRCNNPIIGFVVIDTHSKEAYTISNGHADGILNTSNLDFLKDCKVYCYDVLSFKYCGYNTDSYIDAQMQYYLFTNKPYESDTLGIINHFTRQYQNCHKINNLVPLYKHEEIALNIFNDIWIGDEQAGLSFYQHQLQNVFYNIERHGLSINPILFEERFSKTFSRVGNICYSQYNYYTTTGRPSNRFGGINFAALNKEDDTRNCFVNRLGTLVEIDFNSYHPRLIASLIGYDFKGENVYEHLAKHYSNTQTPTQEDIEKAKEMTFRQIYGGIQQQYMHIPFFASIEALAQEIWREANSSGYVESPISKRRLVLANYQDITVYTLFNYFIQMYETEQNVTMLDELFKTLDKDIVPILYTYDSILFDLPKDKCELLQESLNKVIPSHFPFKIKTGSNYKCLQ